MCFVLFSPSFFRASWRSVESNPCQFVYDSWYNAVPWLFPIRSTTPSRDRFRFVVHYCPMSRKSWTFTNMVYVSVWSEELLMQGLSLVAVCRGFIADMSIRSGGFSYNWKPYADPYSCFCLCHLFSCGYLIVPFKIMSDILILIYSK